jgi:hypothetical protein
MGLALLSRLAAATDGVGGRLTAAERRGMADLVAGMQIDFVSKMRDPSDGLFYHR